MSTDKTPELGDKVKDTVTGFKGIATAKSEFLNGCVRFLITPEVVGKAQTLPDEAWFDVARIEVLKKSVVQSFSTQQPALVGPGGPQNDAPARTKEFGKRGR